MNKDLSYILKTSTYYLIRTPLSLIENFLWYKTKFRPNWFIKRRWAYETKLKRHIAALKAASNRVVADLKEKKTVE